MDLLLGKVTQQAMNYAIRSGITITTTYAIRQCGRLLQEAPRSKERDELKRLQLRLDSKIRIISPAIDMIELISARGNTSLESAVTLTKELRFEIQALGTRMNEAADEASAKKRTREETERELKGIVSAIRDLLERIEDAVPLINLAITTSGVNLSTKMSGSISASRLLQASTFLTTADSQYTADPTTRQQVGPTYNCSLYMLFAGHVRPTSEEGVRETTWKEVIHKANVKLVRVPLDGLYDLPGEQSTVNSPASTLPADAKAAEFAYQLVVVEDLDDDRVHTFEEDERQPGPFEDVANAGIRDLVPIHEISKIFYADTGKILGIGGDSEVNNPVLLLKRDVHAEPPRRMMQQSPTDSYLGTPSKVETNGALTVPAVSDERTATASTTARRLPADLDPEWMALEVYTEDPDTDDEDLDETPAPSEQPLSARPSLTGALSKLRLSTPSSSPQVRLVSSAPQPSTAARSTLPAIKTNLSLLEMLLKLTALQQFRQESHLSISDELLNFFLEDAGTPGAGKDGRKRVRQDALRRVGFDPYDESPVKKRGEDYIISHNAVNGGYGGVGYVDYERSPASEVLSSPSPQPPLLLRQTPT